MSDERRIEEDREFIRRMAAKDAKALDAFYERYNRIAFSLIFRIVGNREDAEDVLVDVFWQVWQQAGRYDESRGKPIGWLLTIARTRSLDGLRSSKRQPAATEEISDRLETAHSPSEPDMFVLADTRRGVADALATLSQEQRTPLELAYYQGMSHSEIAATLNLPLGTVKDRIRNGMMHLRKRLKPYL